MSVREHPWDVLVAVLSFGGIVYLFLSIRGAWESNAYPYGFAVCGLLWLPALVLLLLRIGRQVPPFRGEVL